MVNKIKVNNADNVETILATLSRENTPIAFQNKLDELMEQGAFLSEEEAIRWIESTPFELELYYEKHSGLFAVETDAIECGADLVSPYTKAEFDYSELKE